MRACCSLTQITTDNQACQGRLRRLFGDFAELDPGVEDALDAVLGTVQRVGVGVYQQGGITGTGETMRDVAPRHGI